MSFPAMWLVNVCLLMFVYAFFFIFTLLCGASKSFMKAFNALIKPFEAPQRSVKIKI